MNNLYDELNRLSRLPDAYREWEAYRTDLTGFVIASTEKGGSALIVGAGESSDLDLARLAVHFSSVALLDCDEESMRRALKRHHTEGIRCICADLVGIQPDRYRLTADRMLEELKTGREGSALDELFLKEIEDGYRTRKPDSMPEPYQWDNVICCGVHSQLLTMYMRMACVYARYAKLDLDRIEKELRGYDQDLIAKVDAQLICMAKQRLVIGAEQERVGTEGGVEGAAQALSDPQFERLTLENETELIWNFDQTQNKRYQMKIRAYRTR